MRRLPFVRHLSVGKLRHRYVSCRHPVEMADVVGLSAVTVRTFLHRWNAHGPDRVTDRRKDNGAAPWLTARRRAAL